MEGMKIHWKAPLQTKGFFKIVELVVAILCLSLVASYGFTGSNSCLVTSESFGRNYTDTLNTFYPLYGFEFRRVYIVPIDGTPPPTFIPQYGSFADATIGQGAQLFVTWSVASMFYCVVAMVVYMLFTANEQWEKVMDILVYADLVFHALWVFFWLVASIDWAVSYNKLYGAIDESILGCTLISKSHSSSAQAGIAVVFGFLSLFLWAVNIFWVLIDTPIYIQWKAKRGGDSYQETP